MTDPIDAQALILRKIAERIQRGLADIPSRAPPGGLSMTPASLHLAKLAHELKTPLSAIAAAAELMRDERFGALGDARYQVYAAGIYENASHALAVINAMLGTSQAHDSRRSGEPSYQQIDLNDIAGRVGASVGALLGAAGLDLAFALEAGLPNVIADPVTVRQMLLNLVTNAMRATPAGGAIRIATRYELAGPVHVSVADTGHGMSREDIARVLDNAREPGATPGPTGGLGIGYPVILALAHLNGARVGIDSVPGEGTTVTITFEPARVIPV